MEKSIVHLYFWYYLQLKIRLIYKSLNNDYDYLTSEEAIMETIEANGYEFNENGKII